MDKLKSEYSVEELLEASKNEIQSNKALKLSKAERNELHVADFIKRAPVKHGIVKIPAILIYDRYLLWCEAEGIRPTTKRKFLKYFKKYFDPFYIKGVKGYKLDPYTFGLTDMYSFYKDPRFVKTKYPFGAVPNFIGVYTAAGRFIARFESDDGYKHFLGMYSSPEEAAERYDVELVNYYGKEEAYQKINYPNKIKEYEAYIETAKTTQVRTSKISGLKRQVPGSQSS